MSDVDFFLLENNTKGTIFYNDNSLSRNFELLDYSTVLGPVRIDKSVVG